MWTPCTCWPPAELGLQLGAVSRPAGNWAEAGACRAPDLLAALRCRSMLGRRRAGMQRQLQPCWSCCCWVSNAHRFGTAPFSKQSLHTGPGSGAAGGAKPCLPLQHGDAANQPPVCALSLPQLLADMCAQVSCLVSGGEPCLVRTTTACWKMILCCTCSLLQVSFPERKTTNLMSMNAATQPPVCDCPTAACWHVRTSELLGKRGRIMPASAARRRNTPAASP